jgi:hypothetical protein
MVYCGEPASVADLDGQREPGQGADTTQAAQPAHHRSELGVRCHHRDRLIESVPACLNGDHGVVVGLEGDLKCRLLEPLPTQPRVVRADPRLATGVDDHLAQEQLGQPVPRSHQVTAAVITGTNRSGALLVDCRDRNRVNSSSPSSRARWTASLASVVPLRHMVAATCSARRPRTESPPRTTTGPHRTRLARPHRHRDRARQIPEPGPDGSSERVRRGLATPYGTGSAR